MSDSLRFWEPSPETVTLFLVAQKIPRWLRWIPLFQSGSLDYLVSVFERAFVAVYCVASEQVTWPRNEADTKLYFDCCAGWEQLTSDLPTHVTRVLPPLVCRELEWYLLEQAIDERLPLRTGSVSTGVTRALLADLRQAVETGTLEFPVDDGFVLAILGTLVISMAEIDPHKAAELHDR
jgi:hypothetical protein